MDEYTTVLCVFSSWTFEFTFCAVVCAYLLSHVRLFVTLWTVVRQTSLSMGILQAGILEWVAMPSSRGSSQPRDRTQVSCNAGRFFTAELPGVHFLVILNNVALDVFT